MARGLGRSKGCKNCLKRKIKCDEKTPSCTQCERGGRQCSGALSTVFLIVESETLNSNPTYKPRDTGQSSEGSYDQQTGALVRRPKRNYQGISKASRRKALVSPAPLEEGDFPPSLQSPQVIADQFLSHFIDFFAKASVSNVAVNSWMVALPNMLAERSVAIERSIIAASMIYVGRHSGNPTIMVESYKWYGSGIAKQRKLLEELQHEQRAPTVEEICTPILLSFFEITCNTSPTGYFHHLMGAARLLEMRGPEECSSGILHQIFLTLRIQLIHQAIAMRTPSIFATEEWLTVPFKNRPKNVFDRVIDSIIVISTIISRLDASQFIENASEAKFQQRLIRSEATKIKTQLDEMWDTVLRDASRTHGWAGDHFQGVLGFDFDHHHLKSDRDGGIAVQHPDESDGTAYATTPPGRVVRFYAESRATAFYSTARILILTILNELGSPPSPPARLKEQIQAHCQCILSIANFLTGIDIGYAYVRLMLPLTLVSRVSTLPSQRVQAQSILEEWQTKAGVAGLCEAVLSDIQSETFHRQP